MQFNKVAVAMIHCDLYESAVPVLEFLTEFVQDGTVLIFDDWNCYRSNPNRGEQRAFKEWLDKNPNVKAAPFLGYNWHGQAFILNK